MRQPLQITFRDTDPSPALESAIRARAGKLDRRFDGIVSGRIVVEKPHRNHMKGNSWAVRITLGLPGGELVVNRDDSQERGHDNALCAVQDAFDAAERRLAALTRRPRREKLQPIGH